MRRGNMEMVTLYRNNHVGKIEMDWGNNLTVTKSSHDIEISNVPNNFGSHVTFLPFLDSQSNRKWPEEKDFHIRFHISISCFHDTIVEEKREYDVTNRV